MVFRYTKFQFGHVICCLPVSLFINQYVVTFNTAFRFRFEIII